MVWTAAAVIGFIIWLLNPAEESSSHIWRALLINFAFFTPIAGGLVILPAVVHTSNGSWSKTIDKFAFIGFGFSIPSILILILLWIGAAEWAPWFNVHTKKDFWLNSTFLFLRDIIALSGFWILAFVYLSKRTKSKSKVIPAYLILTYCVVITLLGIDLIMALKYEWSSTLFGGYFFISGIYMALIAWTIISLVSTNIEKDVMHDLGKLILAFAVLTTYMVYSQLNNMWYENLPSETIFLAPRMNFQPWYSVSLFVIFVVYLGPVVLLLTQWAKRTKWYLLSISILLLVSSWIERYWLVNALFEDKINFGVSDFSAILLFTGLFFMGMALTKNLKL